MKVVIIAISDAALSLAFHFSQRGHEVLLYISSKYQDIADILKRNSNFIVAAEELNGVRSQISGSVKIDHITDSVEDAVKFSRYIVSACSSCYQGDVFKTFLPYLKADHIFISMPGNFGLFEYLDICKQYHGKGNCSCDIIPCVFVESSTMPFACRKRIGDSLFIDGVKNTIEFGVFPSNETKKVLEEIQPLFETKTRITKNIMKVGLSKLGLVGHPPVIILNTGHIERDEKRIMFYNEGITHSIYNVMKALDKERLKIAEHFKLDIDNHLKSWKRWFNSNESSNDPLEFFKSAQFYKLVNVPDDLNCRYFIEDFTFCIIPLIDYVCKPNGIDTPTYSSLRVLAETLMGKELKCERPMRKDVLEFIMNN